MLSAVRTHKQIRYLDIDSPYFEQMVGQKCPTKLKSNKASSFDTVVPRDLDFFHKWMA